MNWIVDTYILESRSTIGDLLSAIRDSGSNLHTTKYVPFADEQDYGPKEFVNGPTILYGTVGYVRKCKIPFMPGALGVGEEMNCNHYYANLPAEDMLNQPFIMMPFAQVKHWINDLLYTFDGKFFLRPNAGSKTFTGMVITKDNHEHELSATQQITSVSPETICLLSKVQSLKGEFRFVVGGGEVIDGSEYRWDDVLDIRRDYPEECKALAEKIAKHSWQPDIVYCVDVALTENNGPKVIELNSFSSAGLYACDKRLVVDRVNEIVIKEYW